MDGFAPASADELAFFSGLEARDHGGILYVEDFDARPGAGTDDSQAAEKPPAPLFSAADLEAARQAGRMEGLQAALADATLVQAELQAAATQALADALAAARTILDRVATARADEASRLLLAALQAALPGTMALHAMFEAAAMVSALAPGLRCEPTLRVRAHADLVDGIRATLAGQGLCEGGMVSVVADSALAAGDVHIAWEDGAATRSTASVWEAVRQALAPLGLPSLKEICHADGC